MLLTTVLVFSTLYVPQPILPLLAEEFSVSGSEVSLLISLTLFPLGLTPIIYGYLIDNRSEEHTSELQSRTNLVCRLLLEKKKKNDQLPYHHTKVIS